MSRFFYKALLVVMYPFVYLFHPRIRRANALRIKYWAADRDFFRQERKQLTLIAIAGASIYASLLYAIPAMVFTTSYVATETIRNTQAAHKAAIRQETPSLNELPEINHPVFYEENDEAETVVEAAKPAELTTEKEQKDRFAALKARAKKFKEEQESDN